MKMEFDKFFNKLIKVKRIYDVSDLDYLEVVICILGIPDEKRRKERCSRLLDDKFNSIQNFPYSFKINDIDIKLYNDFPEEVSINYRKKYKENNIDILSYLRKIGYKDFTMYGKDDNSSYSIKAYYRYYKKIEENKVG